MASALADALDAAVVTGDDFYADLSDDDRRSLSLEAAAESMFDWRRLRDEALIPLRQRRVASYRPYDWSSGAGLGADAMTIAPAELVVLDGVYSGRPDLADFVDVAVVVHCPRPERLQRLAARAHGNEACMRSGKRPSTTTSRGGIASRRTTRRFSPGSRAVRPRARAVRP